MSLPTARAQFVAQGLSLCGWEYQKFKHKVLASRKSVLEQARPALTIPHIQAPGTEDVTQWLCAVVYYTQDPG